MRYKLYLTKKISLLIIAGIFLLTVAGCGFTSSGEGTSGAASEETGSPASPSEIADVSETEDDTGSDNVPDGYITFSDGSVSVGKGAKADGTTVTVTSGGTYTVSGACPDGRIIVDAASSDKVELILDGIELTCRTSAPIYAIQSDKLIINIKEGTKNTLSDTEGYVFDDETDKPNAVIFSQDDITIKGEGTLTVNANYNNGISSTNDIKITSGGLTINAVNTAIRGKDSVRIGGGNFVISCDGDAIKASNETEGEEEGYIEVTGGDFYIDTGEDGIEAVGAVTIKDGSFDIRSGAGSMNTPTTDSDKGIKSGTDIQIYGGVLVLNCCDDGIHSNGTLSIFGGDITISSGDDGIHADAELTISGGKITITKSYEGIEGLNLYITGGEISVTASDDGLNAAGGTDTSGAERPGAGQFGRPGQGGQVSGGSHLIAISGGIIHINAGVDGIDSNGALTISGGEVYIGVSGTSAGGDGALDCDGNISITGGTVVASGGNAVVMMGSNTFNSTGTQPALLFQFSQSKASGTLIELKDSSGSTVASYTAQTSFKQVVFSSELMKSGEKYTVCADGTAAYTVTLSGVLTSITETGGSINNSGMGGGFGGRR